jgi:hypothetical protein
LATSIVQTWAPAGSVHVAEVLPLDWVTVTSVGGAASAEGASASAASRPRRIVRTITTIIGETEELLDCCRIG